METQVKILQAELLNITHKYPNVSLMRITQIWKESSIYFNGKYIGIDKDKLSIKLIISDMFYEYYKSECNIFKQKEGE